MVSCSRILAPLASLVLLIGAAGCERPPLGGSVASDNVDERARFVLHDFRLVEEQAGAVSFVVDASEGRFYQESERIDLAQVALQVDHGERGPIVGRGPLTLSSPSARLTLFDGEASFKGGVEVLDGSGGSFRASAAHYDPRDRQLLADGPIRGDTSGMAIEGAQAAFDIDREMATFEGGVWARFSGWSPEEAAR